MSRIITNNDGIRWDPDVQGPIDLSDDDFTTCASTDNFLRNFEDGTTGLGYLTGLGPTARHDRVMQLQLCAWYAKFMATSQYKAGGRFSLYRLAAKLGTWAGTVLATTGFTAMDTLMLLDGVLLHEVMNPGLCMRDANLA